MQEFYKRQASEQLKLYHEALDRQDEKAQQHHMREYENYSKMCA